MTENKIELSQEDIAELKSFFQKNDITKTATLDKEYTLGGKHGDIFAKAKGEISDIWSQLLPELGIKRQMKNYSAEYPVKLLKDTDARYFAEQIADIYTDEDKFKNAVGTFFDIYSDQLTAGFEAYAKMVGKNVDDLSDDEIKFVIDNVADAINGEQIKDVMIGQQVPEIYGISNKTKAHEDYNDKVYNNPDKASFDKRWYHSDTKIGQMLSLEELQEQDYINGTNVIENARNYFDNGQSSVEDYETEYMNLRNAFAATLCTTDLSIFEMREKGMTTSEIAIAMGLKTHSAVVKRLAKMKEKYMEFRKTYMF